MSNVTQIKKIARTVSPINAILECKRISFPTFYERVGFENYWDWWINIYRPKVGAVTYLNHKIGPREKQYLEKKGCEITDLHYDPCSIKIKKVA